MSAIHEGRYSAAVRQLEDALLQSPNDPVLTKALVKVYLKAGDASAAARIYRNILSAEPGNVLALKGLLDVTNVPAERNHIFTALQNIARTDSSDHHLWTSLSRVPWRVCVVRTFGTDAGVI